MRVPFQQFSVYFIIKMHPLGSQPTICKCVFLTKLLLNVALVSALKIPTALVPQKTAYRFDFVMNDILLPLNGTTRRKIVRGTTSAEEVALSSSDSSSWLGTMQCTYVDRQNPNDNRGVTIGHLRNELQSYW